MSVNKSFIVKKGIEVSNNLIFANDELNKVGIGSTVPKGKLDVNGDIRTKDLNVSGIATISIITGTIGTVTNLTGTNINYTGIGTFENLVGTSVTALSIVGSSLNYGIGTFAQLNSDQASLYQTSGAFFNYTGFGTVTNLRSLSGIVTNLSGTNLNYTGIGTLANFVGTSATITNITGTSGTITRLLGTNLSFSGIGTINNIRIISGIITAVSGIITFFGDGSNLTSVKPVPAGDGNREIQFNLSGITSASSNLKFINDNELIVNNTVTSSYLGVGTASVNSSLSVSGFTTFFSFGSNKLLEITPTQNTIQLYSQNYQNQRRRWLTYPFKPYIHTLADLSTRQSLFVTEIDWIISNYPVTTTSTVGTLQDNSGFTTSITAAYGYNTDTDIVLHNRLFLGGRHPRASDDDECGLWISPGGILGDGNSASNSLGPIANRPVIDTYFGDNTTVGALSARMRLSGYVKGDGSNGAEFASINFDSQISPDNQFNFERGKAKIWAKNVIDLTNPKAQYGSSLVFGASKLGPQNSGQNSSTYSDILEIRGDDYLRILPNVTGIQFGGTSNAINYDGLNNFRIITNSSEKVAITSTGRIGIGTTIPASSTLVSIAGTIGFSELNGNGSRTLLSSSPIGFILNHNDNSNLFFQTQGLTRFRWDHNAVALIIGAIQPTGTPFQRFQVEGGAYFQNSVGIGTTNPGESLEVAGNIRVGSSSTQNFIAFRGTTLDNQIPFTHSYIGERVWDPNTERSELVVVKCNDPGSSIGPDRVRLIGAEIRFDTYSIGHSGLFHEVASSPNNLNRFVIKPDGTIGIGTETTKALLDVRGEATFGEGVIPSELSWAKDTNQRVYSFSGTSGTNPSDGTILLANPNVNPSATRIGSLIFGNKTAANPATTNAGIKAIIETFTNTNVANASDTGGYLNIKVKPNAGNLYTIATFDSTKLQVFGNIQATQISSGTLVSTVSDGTPPFTVTSTTQVNNLNAQYVNGKSVGTSGNTIPLLNTANTWSAQQSFTSRIVMNSSAAERQIAFNNGTTDVYFYGQSGASANVGMYDITNNRSIWYYSPSGNQLQIDRNTRFTASIGLDAGQSLFFGREEFFGATNIGGFDYGYIIWDNDNNTYLGGWGDSTENGCLRIGTEDNGADFNADSMALEPSSDLWLNPRLGRVHFHKKNSSTGGQNVFTGLIAPSDSNGRAQFVMSSSYSDLVIASSQVNNVHGSTLTFATYNPLDSTNYRKFVVNQGNWGSRAGFLEFGYSDTGSRSNPHSNINDTDTVLTLDGYNKRVGIGRRTPGSTLDVVGESRFTADNAIVAIGTNITNDVWGGSIEIREINLVTNTQLSSAYAPGITFHWGSVDAAAIKMYSDGSIRFIANGSTGSSYRPIYASQFVSNIPTASGAPFTVTSTTQVNNLNAQYVNGKSVGTSGNTIPLLDTANTWSAQQSFISRILMNSSAAERQIAFNNGTTDVYFYGQSGSGNVGMYDGTNTRSIWYYSPTGNRLEINRNTRFTGLVGLDAGQTLFFGREESFGGGDIGGSDYGYIIWDNDNNTYLGGWGDSTENGCLRIGAHNDPVDTNADSLALEPTADLWLNPGAGRVHFHKKNSSNGGQNVFLGLVTPSINERAQFVMSSSYSDLVIASSQSNNVHGSTLTFATYNPSDSANYRKFVVNQGNWGSRAGFLEFGFSDVNGKANPHENINDTDTVLTLDGYNKRVGIGRRTPGSTLDVVGESRFTADNAILSTGTAASDDVWGGSIEIREINQVGNTQTASAYAPGITFHWGNIAAAGIKMYSDGSIRFIAQGSSGSSYRPIYASQFVSNIPTASGAPFTVSSTQKVINLNADFVDGYSAEILPTAGTIAVRDASSSLSINGVYTSGRGLSDSARNRFHSPGGASYTTQNSSIIGAIRIRLPFDMRGSNTMMSFRVSVYNYVTGTSQQFFISGYNYFNGTWYNTSAISLMESGNRYTVRFGNDASYNYVYIGELNSSWSYPQVFVTDFCGGYSGNSVLWADEWSIGFESISFAGITDTRVAGLDANSFSGVSSSIYASSLRANRNITGGGSITVNASYNVLWNQRFIVISNGTGSGSNLSGYFDITCPTAGTVITGVGGASSVTATSAGIPLAAWHAIYYILPIGSNNSSLSGNFRVASYVSNVTIPYNWVLICVRNGDNDAVYFNNGIVLRGGETLNGILQDNDNIGNTLVRRDGSGSFSAGTITATLSGNASTSSTFSTNRSNYKGITDNAVSGQLMWKNYGNGHTIFDASQSTSPNGGAVNNTNAQIAWSSTYPTLMGWNGSNTYGVRVDSARVSDNISNSGTVTLASATESNSIYITQPSYTTNQPVKLLNFDWYGNTWSIGNIRSGSTPSNGLGIYASGAERLRVTTSGMTVQGTVSATSYTGDGGQLTGIIGKAAAMALIFG